MVLFEEFGITNILKVVKSSCQDGKIRLLSELMNLFRKNILYIAWATALVATLVSLYFSEFLYFTPCILCWYQRIAMYPLTVIILAGILRKDKNLPFYALPLSIFGLLVSIYQNLLYFRIIPETISPCTVGVSCLTKYTSFFGFVDIPLLSFFAFLLITICMLIYRKASK